MSQRTEMIAKGIQFLTHPNVQVNLIKQYIYFHMSRPLHILIIVVDTLDGETSFPPSERINPS